MTTRVQIGISEAHRPVVVEVLRGDESVHHTQTLLGAGATCEKYVHAEQTLRIRELAPGGSGPTDAIQIGGRHYISKAVQPWTAMQSWMTPEQFRGFLLGNAIKYLARCDDKGGVVDLRKARHYLDKLISIVTED